MLRAVPGNLRETRQSGTAVMCRNLRKSYGTGENAFLALKDVNFEAKFHELTVIMGPSGCGKTSLISTIAGTLRPDSGQCQVVGSDIGRLNDSALTKWRGENVGFVFQGFHLVPTLTAAENVAVPLFIRGEEKEEALKRAERMLGRLGIGEKCYSFPTELSGGQQQRIAIGRALIGNPKLLVCDEPTSALDSTTGDLVMRILRHVAHNRSCAVIVVTHDARVLQYADTLATMADGKIEHIQPVNNGERNDASA